MKIVAKMSQQSTMPCLIDVKSHTSDRHEDPESNRMLFMWQDVYRKKVLLKTLISKGIFFAVKYLAVSINMDTGKNVQLYVFRAINKYLRFS